MGGEKKSKVIITFKCESKEKSLFPIPKQKK